MDPFNGTNESSNGSWSENQTTSNTADDTTTTSPYRGRFGVQTFILCAFLVVFVISGAIANFFVLLSYKFEKKLRGNFQILIRNQAIADFTVCAFSIPYFTSYLVLDYWHFGRVWCAIAMIIDYGGATVSVYALLAICVDRLWATKWCHHYRKYNTRKKAVVMCIIVWIVSWAVFGYPIISDRVLRTRDHECFVRVDENEEYIVARTFIVMYGSGILIAILYSVVFYEIRKMTKNRPGAPASVARNKVAPSVTTTTIIQISEHATAHETTAENEAKTAADPKPGTSHGGECSKGTKSDDAKVGQQEKAGGKAQQGGSAQNEVAGSKSKPKAETKGPGRKSFVTLTYIVVAFILCWYPIGIGQNVARVYPELHESDVYAIVYFLPYANSVSNPFLYALGNADFRSTFVKMVKCYYCTP